MSDQAQTASQQDWLELAVEVDPEAVEPVAELFSGYGFNHGVVIEEPIQQDPDGDNLRVDASRPVMVRTYLAAADVEPAQLDDLRQKLWHLGRLRTVGELTVNRRREEDWANAWKEHYQVHRVGRRTVVRPPWQAYEPAAEDVVIELDPGMAFGTGIHPSTKLAMLGLEDELRPDDRVFDVGTGSGILAIAAVQLGARHVDAVDIEPVAVRSASENAARNRVGDRIALAVGSAGPDAPFTGTYDLVLANIIARILIELAPHLARAVAPGGRLVLSGIIESREPAVMRAFEGEGLTIVRRMQMEDWVGQVWQLPALKGTSGG